MANFLHNKIKSAIFIFYYLMVSLVKWLPRKKSPDNGILIIKIDNIGDYLLCKNFWAAVKQEHPEQKITLLGNSACKDLAEKWDHFIFDQFIWLDLKKFLKQPFYALKLFYKFHQLNFETIIQPTLSRSWGDLFVLAANAQTKIGSLTDHATMSRAIEKIGNRFYTKLFPLHEEYLFDLYWYQKFFSETCQNDYPLILSSKKYEKQNTISIFIGASQDYKIWDVSNFIQVIEWLYRNSHYQVILLGGKKELPLNQKVMQHFHSSEDQKRITSLVAKQNLTELVATIGTSKFLISNDTLAPHIAIQTETPLICVSNGSGFGRFHPYPNEISNIGTYLYPPSFVSKMQNHTFYNKHFGQKVDDDINEISPEVVIHALASTLEISPKKLH